LVSVGEKVFPNQILASVVKVTHDIPKNKVDVSYFLNNLTSLVLSERYTAAKALSYFSKYDVSASLLERIRSGDEHIYVKLEAAASLARFNVEEGYRFLNQCLKDDYLQNVLETVIVLAEIHSDKACAILSSILVNENFNPEIRAGAAWGLGEQQNKIALAAIVKSFGFVDEGIKIEAARALAKLTTLYSDDVLDFFGKATPSELPGVAWALARSKSVTLDQIIANLTCLETRQWGSYVIGMQGRERYVAEIEKLKDKDPEVYFATTLLWKIITNWIYELKEY